MEFGWINLFGAGIVVLIMIPNIIFALKQKQSKTGTDIPKCLSVCEQIGRYGYIILMWLPLFVWEFGFGSAEELIIYLIANGVLLLGYYLFWVLYSREKTLKKSDGVIGHSNCYIPFIRHTASPLDFSSCSGDLWICTL